MSNISKAVAFDLSEFPSVDEILRGETAAQFRKDIGAELTTRMIRSVIDELKRDENYQGKKRDAITPVIERRLKEEHAAKSRSQFQCVINATGVIIHTNLGRAPLSKQGVEAAANAARYVNLEFDLSSGERGRRGASAEAMLAQVTGAEDALVVNNCAGAAFLMLSVFGRGGDVIVSRGELVEIGGDFRIPDVLERSGAKLREVGTTNRTKLADYERAIATETKLILCVHPSNYRVVGFTERPALSDLAELAHRHGILLFEDAGSGAMVDLSSYGLNEPLISDSIKAGADLVSFSGDKLMGGAQAGMIVGRKSLLHTLRKDPLYRALRPDKITLAVTDATLRSYVRGTEFEDIPVLKFLATGLDEIEVRAKSLVERIDRDIRSKLTLSIMKGNSTVGGGSAPGVLLPTALIAIEHNELNADQIAKRFRNFATPIIGRVSEGKFVIDLRTMFVEDEVAVARAFASLAT